MADQNFEKLKDESDRLEQHAKKSVNWLLWIMLIVVCFIFISMILFIRIFPKLKWLGFFRLPESSWKAQPGWYLSAIDFFATCHIPKFSENSVISWGRLSTFGYLVTFFNLVNIVAYWGENWDKDGNLCWALTRSLVDRPSPVFNVTVENVMTPKRHLIHINISNSPSLKIFPVFTALLN